MQLGIRGHVVTVFRHWFKIALVIVGAILVTGAIAFLSSKVYVAETRVLILTRSPAARAASTNFTDEAKATSPQEQVLTQVEILKSPLLAMRLAEQLGPERVIKEMTWRWDWLRALPQVWKNQAILALYEWDLTRDLIVASGINIPTGVAGPPSVEDAAEVIGDNLEVEAILKTDMFGAAFAAPDAEFAADALNKLIAIYTDHVVALGSPVRTAEIAQLEANRLERELRDREKQLRDYVEDNRILSIERQKNLLLDRRARVQDELANARRERLESTQKIVAIEGQILNLPSAEAVSVTTVANPLLDRLRERLAQLETEFRQFVPGSPSANKIQIEIDGIRTQLASAETAVRGSETVGTSGLYQQLQGTLNQELADRTAQEVRVEFVSRQLDEVEAELLRLDELELRYIELRRMVDAKEEAFRFALQKREETAIADQLSEGSGLSQVVQVEPATEPPRAAAPRRFRLLALGVIVGGMFGVGLSYILEFSRRTMITRREAEIALGLPVLVSQQMSGLIRRRTRANRTEIRSFTSRLLHQLKPGKPRVLMLISASRQTGQTTVISAITDVLAGQGSNVLIVQLGLSRQAKSEVQVTIKGADNKPVRNPGEYTAVDAHDQRRDTALIKGPAGKIHAALSELLRTRGRMYDVVMIDCPDLNRFPEALFIVSLVDNVLPVVMAGRSRVDLVLETIAQFRDVQATVPGVVLTKLRHSQPSWAFCWMSMMRLDSANQADRQASEYTV